VQHYDEKTNKLHFISLSLILISNLYFLKD
jgi:uncharacterized membrane protein YfhO